jgi:hypothetical protein
LITFLNKKRTAFAEFRRLGMDLMGTAAGRHLIGHLVLKQGYFTTNQKQRVKVTTWGSIDIKELDQNRHLFQ